MSTKNAIVNFDKLIYGSGSGKNELKNRHKLAPTWGHSTHRVLLCGPSGTGKTNTLLNLLLRYLNYDEIHIVTKDRYEESYEFLQKRIDEVSKKVKHDVLHWYGDVEELPEASGLDKEFHKVVIFDDQISVKDQSKIMDYFIMGRKNNIACYYLTQSFFKTPKLIREQCNYFILFKLPSDREIGRIHGEIGNDKSKDEFKRLLNNTLRTKGDSLLIDTKTDDPKLKYRKNIIIPIKN